jgi:hypothetical protein
MIEPWRKSSWTGANGGNCVELAVVVGGEDGGGRELRIGSSHDL